MGMGRNFRIGVASGLLALSVMTAQSQAATAETSIVDLVDEQAPVAIELAQTIWEHAELGYLEQRSSAALQAFLQQRGFSIRAPVAGMPTSFIASYGAGEPIIGILAEFDALPGLSQAAQPSRNPLVEGGGGHACGHHLFGAASATAGVAIAQWREQSGRSGTIRVYGTPAEEGGSGKVYMTRAGLFDDVGVVLHWHPSDRNSAAPSSSTSNKSGRFTFHGIAAHAAAAPERGRSALDGVEAMNYMVNMMREHVPSDARIHYVITNGGDAPNIVPETAQVYYYVRHPQAQRVLELFERVVTAAEAGALGTGTTMDYEVMHGNFPVLPNETLSRLVDANLRELGGFEYAAEELAFAEEIRKTLPGELLAVESSNEIQAFVFKQGMGSTDVGDVSWNVPTAGFGTATWVPGTPAHSWQAVAAGGTSIGHKGMLLAAQLLAKTAQDLYLDPVLIEAPTREMVERRGAAGEYEALLGDRLPPLEYR